MQDKMKRRWHSDGKMGLICGFLLVCLFGCKGEPVKQPDAASAIGNVKPEQPLAPPATPVQESAPDPLPDLKLESLTIADFLGQFKFAKKPKECVIATDFAKKVDPTLHHFERVEVILPDTRRQEIKLQNFGAWAIWKNEDRNYEMLTTMVNNIGVLMHIHTLSPRFELLGSFEVARRSYIQGDESIKQGHFEPGDNYMYTVVTTRKGEMIDSLNGLVVIAASGNYKVMDEVR